MPVISLGTYIGNPDVEKKMKHFAMVLLFLTALLSGSALAQDRHLPLSVADVIDGKKNPELIPDHVAYRMVLISLTVPTDGSATPQDFDHQNAVLTELGLTGPQRAAFVELLTRFRSGYDGIQKEGNTLHPKKGLKELKKGLVQDHLQKLLAILSAEQLAKLQRLCAKAKAHIVTTERE